jgi:hypothetical protein
MTNPAVAAVDIAELRARIERIAESERAGEALPTGIAELDAALAMGGVPRGRVTEIIGTRSGGKTTLARRLVAQAIARGEPVAVIDGSRTLAPRDWAPLARAGVMWMVRPKSAKRAAWCADVVLRSGAFGLVVLDGAPPLSSGTAARLTRLARDAGAALVVVGDAHRATQFSALRIVVARRAHRVVESSSHRIIGSSRASRHHDLRVVSPQSAVRTPQSFGTRRRRGISQVLAIRVEKGGHRRTVEVEHGEYGWSMARRLCAHTEVPDRRGVERTRSQAGERSEARTGSARPALAPPGAGAPGSAGSAISTRVPPRSRRCAEPNFGQREVRPRIIEQREVGCGHACAGMG